jgi:hypothetical protein
MTMSRHARNYLRATHDKINAMRERIEFILADDPDDEEAHYRRSALERALHGLDVADGALRDQSLWNEED